MQGAPLELDRVVPGDLARVLEAEDPLQEDGRVQGTIGCLGQLGRHTELLVEPGQEFLQHSVGLINGDGSRQPEFADQPVLEGAGHAFHPALGLWRTGKDLFNAQFLHGPGKMGWTHGLGYMPGLSGKLEDPVAIAIESQGGLIAADDPLHQQEVAPGVLIGLEDGARHRAGSIIHRQQQGEPRPPLFQPGVMAAVDLQQHALLGHPLPPYPVFGGTVPPGAGQTVAVQETAHRLATQVNTFPVRQHLAQVAVVEAGVLPAGQDDHGGGNVFVDRVAGLTSSVAVDQCGGPFPPVGRQDSPDLAFTDPQNFGSLGCGQLIFQHAVQYLESGLLSLVQCHVLHRRTFSLSDLLRT